MASSPIGETFALSETRRAVEALRVRIGSASWPSFPSHERAYPRADGRAHPGRRAAPAAGASFWRARGAEFGGRPLRGTLLWLVADSSPEDFDLSFVRDLPLTQDALAFARERHGGQRRDADGAPFIAHPLEVASLLERSSYPDHVVAAAVLHDVLEDTDVGRAELESRFGQAVSELVVLVSDDPSVADEERRKDDVRERVRKARSEEGLVLFAADKVSKVRELRMLIPTGLAPGDAKVKLQRYRKSLQMLEQELPEAMVVGLLRFELEALERLPPAPDPQAPGN